MERTEALEWIEAVHTGQAEDAAVEVKAARRKLPKRLYEALSALANRTGGVIILGLDETKGFAPTGVRNVHQVLTELSDVAARMVPPLRLEPCVVEVEGQQVIVTEVPECPYDQKPCYFGPAGLNSGSYIRVGNTNRRMTDYEIFTFVSGRGQPTFDADIVRQATLEDLDPQQVTAYLERIRRDNPRLWRRLRLEEKGQDEQLAALGLAAQVNGAFRPTLAGLLMFGIWPQRYFPSLVITFVRYYGTDPAEKGPRGERFLDNRKFEGPIPEMIEEATRRVVANMRQSTLVEGLFHHTMLEYPEEAAREAIVNAVAHRDYSPYARGSQIRIQMFADRLEVQSPGGLFGPVNEENLEETMSTRNQLLMRLLEEVGLVENRGSGIRAMIAAMREARLEPPRFHDTRNYFRVTFKNNALMTPEALRWLNQFAGHPLSDNQRMALVYLRDNERMTNSDYRRLNNVYDTAQATRELRELVETGLVRMHGTRRWAYYTLAVEAAPPPPIKLEPEEEQILAYIKKKGSISRGECQDLLNVSPTRAAYLLKRLRNKGMLRMEGTRRWARYFVRGNYELSYEERDSS